MMMLLTYAAAWIAIGYLSCLVAAWATSRMIMKSDLAWAAIFSVLGPLMLVVAVLAFIPTAGRRD